MAGASGRQYVTAAGDTIEVSVGLSLIRDGDGSALHVIALIDDVSSRKRYESHLRHMADHDPLTALPNRVRMEQALDAQVARVRRYAPVGALLIIDVDHFKQINDRLGHTAGDRILVGIARILQTRVRDTDVLARLSAVKLELGHLGPDYSRLGAAEGDLMAGGMVALVSLVSPLR